MTQARGIVMVLWDYYYDHKSGSLPWTVAWSGIISANIVLQTIILWMRGKDIIFDSVKAFFVIEQFDELLGGCIVYYVWEPRAFMTPPKKPLVYNKLYV